MAAAIHREMVAGDGWGHPLWHAGETLLLKQPLKDTLFFLKWRTFFKKPFFPYAIVSCSWAAFVQGCLTAESEAGGTCVPGFGKELGHGCLVPSRLGVTVRCEREPGPGAQCSRCLASRLCPPARTLREAGCFPGLRLISTYNYLHISLQFGILNWRHMNPAMHVKRSVTGVT